MKSTNSAKFKIGSVAHIDGVRVSWLYVDAVEYEKLAITWKQLELAQMLYSDAKRDKKLRVISQFKAPHCDGLILEADSLMKADVAYCTDHRFVFWDPAEAPSREWLPNLIDTIPNSGEEK